MYARKRRFAEGGGIDELEALNRENNPLDTTPGPKAEPEMEKPKTFSQAFAEARKAGEKTFTWNGKKYGTEMAGSKPAKASSASAASETSAKAKRDSDVPDMRQRLAARFGTGVLRGEKNDPNAMIPQEDIDAAKAAGNRRRAEQDAGGPFYAAKETLRNIMESGRKSRERLRGEAEMARGGTVKKYAKGGSVSASSRADGCAQRGKTRGKMV